MLTCESVTRKVSQAQDRKLTLRERIGVKLHLLICYACRCFVRQLTILSAASHQAISENFASDAATLTESARQRIRDNLQNSADKHSDSDDISL